MALCQSLEYDRLSKASWDVMGALQFGLQSQLDSSWKSRVRSRLILAEIAINRHITDCKIVRINAGSRLNSTQINCTSSRFLALQLS